MKQLLEHLKTIGLSDEELPKQITAFIGDEVPVVISRNFLDSEVKLSLEIKAREKGELELLGYELWKHRPVEIPQHFNNGTPTRPIEELLKLINFPSELPMDFISRLDENKAYDQIAGVFQEFDHLEFFLLDEADENEIKQVREMVDSLLIKYGIGNGLENYLLTIDEGYWKNKFYEVFSFPPELHTGVVLNKINDTGSVTGIK
ncbi:hypothetical protein ACFOWA_19430 [Pedobacter lithocola]|uniref:Uncharacterized protein n=1 Tax=Pedobacter lithocola TaxID=1908239 RepID=A0ABV8PH25_9SPHI